MGRRGDWPLYVEWLEIFFPANGISDGELQLTRSYGTWCLQTSRGRRMYAALVEALLQHFKPKPSVIVERLKCHSRVREPGESVATYVAGLHTLSL